MNTFKFPHKIKLTQDQKAQITVFMDEEPPNYVTATEVMLIFEKVSRILIEEADDNKLTLQLTFTKDVAVVEGIPSDSPTQAMFDWVYSFIEAYHAEQ